MKSRGKNTSIRFWVALLLLTSLAAITFGGDSGPREIGRTTEKELNVVLSSSFGSVHISRGDPEKILVAESFSKSQQDAGMYVDYTVRNRVGYLDISVGEEGSGDRKKGGFNLSALEGAKAFLRFSTAVPVSFDISLGVGKGEFDLTGLQVKDFTLTSGASDVRLTFSEPNRTSIDNLNIESGVSKFSGENLGNANFRRLRFQGGVGTYSLDFSGTLKHEVDVDIDVGLGVLTIMVPGEIGARVYHEKSWVSRLDCDRDFRSQGNSEYISDNYHTAPGKMNIRIDSGVGSIKVRRK